MSKLWTCLAMAASVAASGTLAAATPDQPLEMDALDASIVEAQFWRVDGGEMQLRFNHEFLDLFGIRAVPAPGTQAADEPGFSVFPLRDSRAQSHGLEFNAPQGGFDRFVGGELQVEGGFELQFADGQRLELRDFTLRASSDNPMHLDLVDASGHSWLYVNHLMYKIIEEQTEFFVRSADLRASPALAFRLDAPELANAYIGELKMLAPVVARSADWNQALRCPNPNFHGTSGPSGKHQADVLMESYTMSFSRCRRSDGVTNGCDGAGPDDGEVVFTPSSTLRNTNHPTTADVPWYQKFTTSPYSFPYPGNDQHPYLIWNMYRIADGQLEQIGASGVKHAFLTTNTGCAAGACTGSGHILGKGCGDTYGTGNNDSNGDLGPRHELVAATGEWGRCGSIFDLNCDGNQNSSGNTSYDQRLKVRESQMQVPGAQYFSDSWYIVQDDINIYNTMAHRTMTPSTGGSGWVPGAQGAFKLGPVLDTWVDPAVFPARNVEYASRDGNVKVAVKVQQLASCPAGSGLSAPCYRWDYAVHNFDWSHAEKEGTPPNLRVLDNRGFDGFALAVPDGTPLYLQPGVHFADIDTNAGNNWTGSVSADGAQWQGPEDNELNWGLLYRFSLVSEYAANDNMRGQVTLQPASDGAPAVQLHVMSPGENPVPTAVGSVPDQSSNEGQVVSLPLSAFFTDPEGEPLSFSAANLPEGLTINAGTGVVSGTIAMESAGSYPVVVSASDPWSGTATQAFDWHVQGGNLPPVAVGNLPDRQHSENTNNVLVATSGGFSDPDGDPLTYSAAGLPPGLSIQGSSGLVYGNLGFASDGVHAVTITATDPEGAFATQGFQWTVLNINRAPVTVGSVGSRTGAVGTAVSLPLAPFFNDPDGDVLEYSASGLPGGLAISTSTGEVTGLPNTAGVFQVTVTASDGTASAQQQFQWTIQDPLLQLFRDGFEALPE